jgi:hypothetical protein
MSEEAIREAKAQNARLAAKLIARKTDLAAEVDKIDKQRAEAAELVAAAGARDDLRIEAEKILEGLQAQLVAKREELDELDAQLALIRKELNALDGLKGQSARIAAEQATIGAGIGADPLIRTPEQIALDNVRSHVADLDSQAKLESEIDPLGPTEPATPTPHMDDVEARRLFEELRAKRDKKP